MEKKTFLYDNATLIELCEKFGFTNNTKFEEEEYEKPTAAEVWGIGLAVMTLVSLCSVAGVILMPLRKRRFYNFTMCYFVGVGVGCLTGTAVFHLFPQAFNLEEYESKEYLHKSWIWVSGIFIFYLIDRLLNIILETKKMKSEQQKLEKEAEEMIIERHPSVGAAVMLAKFAKNGVVTQGDHIMAHLTDQEDLAENDKAGALDVHVTSQTHDRLSSVAPIILAGDSLHHLVDGMSIGAAFARSLVGGVNIGIAVFCEEFPRELGDVALLVTAGLSWRRALIYNLWSGMSGFLGFIIGALVGETSETAATYVFSLAGGMFIYISLAIMLPEMREQLQEAITKSLPHAVRMFIIQNFGLLTGLVLMYILAAYANNLEF